MANAELNMKSLVRALSSLTAGKSEELKPRDRSSMRWASITDVVAETLIELRNELTALMMFAWLEPEANVN